MLRSDLLKALAKDHPELGTEDIERVVDLFFDEIGQRLVEHGRVELRGFGTFSTRERDARDARNPRTGEAVSTPAKRVAHFKPGRAMRDRLSDNYIDVDLPD